MNLSSCIVAKTGRLRSFLQRLFLSYPTIIMSALWTISLACKLYLGFVGAFSGFYVLFYGIARSLVGVFYFSFNSKKIIIKFFYDDKKKV